VVPDGDNLAFRHLDDLVHADPFLDGLDDAYGDAHVHNDIDGHGNVDEDPHSDLDSYVDGDVHSDAIGDAHIHPHEVAYPDGDEHAHVVPDGDDGFDDAYGVPHRFAYGYASPHGLVHSDPFRDGFDDAYGVLHRDGFDYGDFVAYAHRDAFGDAAFHINPEPNGERDEYADPNVLSDVHGYGPLDAHPYGDDFDDAYGDPNRFADGDALIHPHDDADAGLHDHSYAFRVDGLRGRGDLGRLSQPGAMRGPNLRDAVRLDELVRGRDRVVHRDSGVSSGAARGRAGFGSNDGGVGPTGRPRRARGQRALLVRGAG